MSRIGDPRRLLVFREVARAGSLAGAARTLGWTQPAAGLGERHAAALPDHQRRPGLGLQASDLLADRRLGPAQRPGRAGQRPGAGDLAEDEQAAGVHDLIQAAGPKQSLGPRVVPVVWSKACSAVTLGA